MNFSFKIKLILFFVFYFIFRLAILNINSAEWGDSYRILRATSFLENLSYPKDEKRPPLYSAFLVLVPNNSDPVLGGRILMVFVSMVTVYLFYLLLNSLNYQLSEKQKLLALILFSFNPLFVYWSMRIYADTFFLMICLLSFVVFFSCLRNPNYLKLTFLALICFFGIMTRFEGYLLISAIFLSFIFEYFQKRDFQILIRLTYFLIIGFGLFLFAINTPWTFFKNPISSSYVDEANRRMVGLFDILGFFLHLVFILGNFFAFYFILFDRKKLFQFIQNNFILVSFLIIELLLAFAWPAAIPRLLVQIVPILIILMLIGLESFYQSKKTYYFLIFPLAIIAYGSGQYLIKSQFLLTNYFFMAVLILISISQVYFIWKKKFNLFEITMILGVVLWMGFFVYLHKDIYKVLNQGVSVFSKIYMQDGIIATNDVSYLTKFYFGDNLKYLRQVDFGIDIEKLLRDRNAKYLIVTNEHNPDMKYSPAKYPYLETIYEYREEVNGREFFVVISKVNLK